MIAFRVPGLRASMLLLSLVMAAYSSAVLAALASGCDDIGFDGQPRIQPNTTVDVFFNPSKTAPPEYVAAMNQAIAELTQQIDGIKFQLTATEDSNASIMVSVESTHSKDVANYAGIASPSNWLATGTLNIYKDQSDPGCNGLCLDPAAPGYQDAIKRTFVHELLHAIGADHSHKANVMLSYFAGKNGKDNPAMNLPCVLPRVQSILALFSPTSPYTCS